MNLVWDMETGDPDDFMTMLWLADHPKINLKAVTVTPGSQAQIGLVRWGFLLSADQHRLLLSYKFGNIAEKQAPLIAHGIIPTEESRQGQRDSHRLAPMPHNPDALFLFGCSFCHGAPLVGGRSFLWNVLNLKNTRITKRNEIGMVEPPHRQAQM